jgi:hypothetical protein
MVSLPPKKAAPDPSDLRLQCHTGAATGVSPVYIQPGSDQMSEAMVAPTEDDVRATDSILGSGLIDQPISSLDPVVSTGQ